MWQFVGPRRGVPGHVRRLLRGQTGRPLAALRQARTRRERGPGEKLSGVDGTTARRRPLERPIRSLRPCASPLDGHAMTDRPEHPITIRQVSEIIGISYAEARRMREAWELPHHYPSNPAGGGVDFWERSDVEAFAAERRRRGEQ